MYYPVCAHNSCLLILAIWLLPDGDSYGGWPYRGEIDVVESLGKTF